MDSGDYNCTHYFYANDSEYVLSAVWEYESVSDIPDSWELKELEVAIQDNGLPDLDVSPQGSVWTEVEIDGPGLETLEKIHYIE